MDSSAAGPARAGHTRVRGSGGVKHRQDTGQCVFLILARDFSLYFQHDNDFDST